MLAANYSRKPIPAAAFAAIKVPVLIVNGEHDAFSDADHVKAMAAAMPHAQVVLFVSPRLHEDGIALAGCSVLMLPSGARS